jgi:hypothetical protein
VRQIEKEAERRLHDALATVPRPRQAA